MKEKIIEKIRKALALANNNKNPNEAQAAMLMAQKMMAKYHIEMEEVQEAEQEEILECETKIKRGAWRKRLAKIICCNYRCDCFIRSNGAYSRIVIVGEKEDVEIVKTVYEFAENQLLDGFNKYFKNNYRTDTPIQIRNEIKIDYARGFCKGLNEKFEKQKQEETNKSAKFALVITNEKVKEKMNQINFSNSYDIGSKLKDSFTDSLAFVNGRDKGLNMIDMHSSINAAN